MIGTTLGPYRVLEKLGAGGTGEVYRARDTRLDRVRRFTTEAQASGALNHPDILAVHDVGAAAHVAHANLTTTGPRG
jgi:serine/threonine protein kinase